MNWKITKNNKPIGIADIPRGNVQQLRNALINQCRQGKRVVSFFGHPDRKGMVLFAVLTDDQNSRLLVACADLGAERAYPSITPEVPALHLFEREIFEQFGIEPQGHPWLKPVRYPFRRFDPSQNIGNYPFFRIEGEDIHEVGVGPIHAGIIEPGHFRFQCRGEKIHHLEIQLGYQHRGVEELFVGPINPGEPRFKPHLAERIAGDSAVAHATAYAQIMESLARIEVSRRAQAIRAIALELERIAVHVGDLGAISNDIAHLLGSAVFGAIRTAVINTSLSLCGSRFGQGLIRPGGVLYDLDDELKERMKRTLNKVLEDVIRMSESMLATSSVLSRLEKTGIVTKQQALDIGLVGPVARASGVAMDTRADHPFGNYRYFPIHKITMPGGDVFARTFMRYVEIKQSVNFILEQLEHFSREGSLSDPVENLMAEGFCVSMVEGWRGEIAHVVLTDIQGNPVRYKIKDPSFNNWLGLAIAVRNNGISDFPLCNKSFNLSYSGHDL